MRLLPALLAAAVLAGCTVSTGPAPQPSSSPPQSSASGRLPASQAAANFRSVVQRMEPVSERICRQERPNANCDFRVVVDDRRDVPPNAFQTLDENGRPIIGFTIR
ncbi:MAG: peptidase M48, partial [Pseudomonadota bacterium]